MEFVNETPFPAEVARAQLLYKDLLLATVVVKATFSVDDAGKAQPATEQVPVSESDVETGYGTLDGDLVPIKAACDIAVMGNAHAPAPVESAQLMLRIGHFERVVHVFGDRVWARSGREYRPSRSEPFTEMPVTYDRAFGGRAIEIDEVRSAYPDNPGGRGLVIREEDVEGTPLPNIEEADQLIGHWQHRPIPAGLAPLSRFAASRGTRGVIVDLDEQTTMLEPAAFSFAHPRMQMPEYPVGAQVTLTGMRRAGPWRFNLPELPFEVDVSLGDARYRLPVTTDTLILLPESDRLIVVARRALVYQFRPERRRCIRLTSESTDGDAGEVTSIRSLRASPSAEIPIAPDGPESTLPLPFDKLLATYPLTRIVEELPLCPSA